jgi:predicted TIM-barrel fold metal-dependent hydrolase
LRPISVDDHVIEPPQVWQDRLPVGLREQGPRVVEKPDGQQVWLYDGKEIPNLGHASVAGKSFEEIRRDPIRFDEMRAGCYDPAERVKDMDIDGVQAQMCFPSFPRFCGQTFAEAADKDLALLCVRAFNDYILEEWYGVYPERFIPLGIIPLWDPLLAVAEIERIAGLGARAIAFSEAPYALGLPSIHSRYWDPVFRAVSETGLALCMHIGSGSRLVGTSPDAPELVLKSLVGMGSIMAACDFMFSHVFHEFPDIKVTLSEGGGGWVPYIMERADNCFDRYKWEDGRYLEIPPSELFKKNIYVCVIDDRVAIELRHHIGVDKMLWESDYPHADSTWPHSRKAIEEMFVGVPEHELRQITELNARTLLNF